jgi:hypothetical protein
MWIISLARKSQLIANEDIISISVITWIKIWLINCFEIYKTVFFTLCLAAISPFAVLFTIKRQWIKNRFPIYFWLIAFSGTLFWAIIGPDVRFGLGFIIITALAPFFMFCTNSEKASLRMISPVLLLFSLLFFLNISFKIIRVMRGEIAYSTLLYRPLSFDSSQNEYATRAIDSVTIYLPVVDDQCFDQALPCMPSYWYPDNIELRGKSIRDGFRNKVQDNIR